MRPFRYHSQYLCIRTYLAAGFGYVASWDTFLRLAALGRSAPCASLLIDAGDHLTEITHGQAKDRQNDSDYTAQRLQSPKSTHGEERRQREDLTSETPSVGPFLELVLAGDGKLRAWNWRRGSDLPGRTVVTAHRHPMEVHCHTPLNQRLLPANLRVCQLLVDCLADGGDRGQPWKDTPPLVAATCFAQCVELLGLNDEEQVALATFGHFYLARYLDWSGSNSSPSVIRRRVRQINDAVEQLQPVCAASKAVPSEEEGFFFPESLWMQFHWFASSLGVSLSQEMALAEALREWAKDASRLRRPLSPSPSTVEL